MVMGLNRVGPCLALLYVFVTLLHVKQSTKIIFITYSCFFRFNRTTTFDMYVYFRFFFFFFSLYISDISDNSDSNLVQSMCSKSSGVTTLVGKTLMRSNQAYQRQSSFGKIVF